jgi:hypothetical protein
LPSNLQYYRRDTINNNKKKNDVFCRIRCLHCNIIIYVYKLQVHGIMYVYYILYCVVSDGRTDDGPCAPRLRRRVFSANASVRRYYGTARSRRPLVNIDEVHFHRSEVGTYILDWQNNNKKQNGIKNRQRRLIWRVRRAPTRSDSTHSNTNVPIALRYRCVLIILWPLWCCCFMLLSRQRGA